MVRRLARGQGLKSRLSKLSDQITRVLFRENKNYFQTPKTHNDPTRSITIIYYHITIYNNREIAWEVAWNRHREALRHEKGTEDKFGQGRSTESLEHRENRLSEEN